jgi:predicted RNase H-like HicB family nuclease
MPLVQYANSANERPMLTSYTAEAPARVVSIIVHQLPEGGLLGTSPDIEGLTVEAESLNELRSEVMEWAPELLRDNHNYTDGPIRYIFNNSKGYTYLR